MIEPRIDFSFHQGTREGKSIVILEIQATRDIPIRFSGKRYIRIGSTTKGLDDYPEKARQIYLKTQSFEFESQIAYSDLTLEETLEKLNSSSYFRLKGIGKPKSDYDIAHEFINEGFIKEHENSYSITNLGAILFAEKLKDFPTLSRKATRVIVYEGIDRIVTKREQEGVMGYAVKFQGLIEYIMTVLPSREVIKDGLRRSISAYPELAIRELVANALIHQDFTNKGEGPMIEIFDDRVEISNSGKPLIDIDRFLDYKPKTRNVLLGTAMRHLKICEERGSGIDKVVFECERNKLPAPKFITDEGYTKAILFAYKTFRQLDRLERISACYLHACLRQVSLKQMTNKTLRERFDIEKSNYPMVSSIISETMKEGLIKYYDPSNKSPAHIKYIPYWA